MRRSTNTWLAVSAWWILTGLVGTGQAVTMFEAAGTAVQTRDLLLVEMASALLWIPITMALFWCVRRHPIGAGHLARTLAVHAAAVVGVIVFRAGAVLLLNDLVGWYDRLPTLPQLLWTSVLNNLLMSWMIIGVAHAIVFAERERRRRQQAQELETKLAHARLHALAAQLNPHFLFNTLNSIAEMVHRDAEVADRMLMALAALLRHSLDSGELREVSLGEELELLGHYVSIEQMRLGPRLHFDCDVASDALAARVPHLLLQPLVENAIRHAIAPRLAPGNVSVRARCADGRLLMEVRDDGDGQADPATRGAGIGLRNTRARLQGLYGPDHRFDVSRQPDGGTLARVDVPFRPSGALA